MTRSRSARAEVHADRSASAIATRARGATTPSRMRVSQSPRVSASQSSLKGSSSLAGLPSVNDLRRMIEETKREVRDIRSVETRTKWQMTREERREQIHTSMSTAAEIRDWRFKQAEGMKSYTAAKAQESKTVQLKESKDFIGFKKEVKKITKEDEIRYQKEVYLEGEELANWEAERAREAAEQDQALVKAKVENVEFLREEREFTRRIEKEVQDEERVTEQTLQMASLARELALEKEKLLQSLEYQTSCQRAAPLASVVLNKSRSGKSLPPGQSFAKGRH